MINRRKQSSPFYLLCMICSICIMAITAFQIFRLPGLNPNSVVIVNPQNQYCTVPLSSESESDLSYSGSDISYDSGDESDNGNDESSINLTPPFNLNTATSRQLQTLSGIGKVKANSIIVMRDALGGFSDLSQLLDVKGIGRATYEKIIPYLYID